MVMEGVTVEVRVTAQGCDSFCMDRYISKTGRVHTSKNIDIFGKVSGYLLIGVLSDVVILSAFEILTGKKLL